MSDDNRREIRVTEEQFQLLWDTFPDDPLLQARMCQEALVMLSVPIPYGRTQSGIRVYKDDGWMGSGYVIVSKEDVGRVSGCLDNGFPAKGFREGEEPIIWDENPERDRVLSIKKTLQRWAYG